MLNNFYVRPPIFNDLDFMITEFDETIKHLHLFTDYHEIQLTKLDLIYANGHFDFIDGVIGCDAKQTMLISYSIELLIMLPCLLIIDMLLNP